MLTAHATTTHTKIIECVHPSLRDLTGHSKQPTNVHSDSYNLTARLYDERKLCM